MKREARHGVKIYTTFRNLADLAQIRRVDLVATAIASAFGAAAEAAALYCFLEVVNSEAETGAISVPLLGEQSRSTVVAVGLAFVIVRTTTFVLLARLPARMSSRALASVRTTVVESYFHSNWMSMTSVSRGDLLLALSAQSVNVANGVLYGSQILASGASMVILLAVAAASSPAASVSMLVAAGILATATRPLSRLTRLRASEFLERQREFAERAAESYAVAEQVKGLQAEGGVIRSLSTSIAEGRASYRRTQVVARAVPLFSQGLGLFLVGGALMTTLTVSGGELPEGVAFSLVALLRVMAYVQQLQSAINGLEEQQPTISHLRELIAGLGRGERKIDGIAVESIKELSASKATLSFGPGRPAVTMPEFHAQVGQFVVLAGESGSGKSTLLRVLAGLLEPDSESIKINGVPRSRLSTDWRRLVAYVPQDVVLVEGSLEANITFFRDVQGSTSAEHALQQAGLGAFVRDLENGVETEVVERRAGLSGGQRQRIAIARALIGMPQVLLVDEPSSGLDDDSERRLIETLCEYSKDAIVIASAHRSAMIEAADVVVRL